MKCSLLACALVSGVIVASCGGKIACDADAAAQCTSSANTVDCTKRACPNDPPITASQTDACKAELTGSCSSQYVAAYQCMLPLVQCDASGKTDPSFSTIVLSKCNTQLNAYQSCKATSFVDAGTK